MGTKSKRTFTMKSESFDCEVLNESGDLVPRTFRVRSMSGKSRTKAMEYLSQFMSVEIVEGEAVPKQVTDRGQPEIYYILYGCIDEFCEEKWCPLEREDILKLPADALDWALEWQQESSGFGKVGDQAAKKLQTTREESFGTESQNDSAAP